MPAANCKTVSVPESPLTIASCCDRGYLPHLATAIRSVSLSGTAVGRWYLFFDDSVAAQDRDRLLSFATECGIAAEGRMIPAELLVGFPAERPSTPIVWLRPLLAELLPDEDCVLSLDCDTLVLHDLGPLWQTELDPGSYFAAVAQPTYRIPNPMHARLGIDSTIPYFNAGVMVMDLNLMRAEDFAERTRAFVSRRDRPELAYNEQDAVNLTFPGRWTALDPVWNAMTAVLMPFVEAGEWSSDIHHQAWVLERAARSPAIVHFEGAAMLKPWCHRCFNPFAPLYRELRATTPWPLQELEGGRGDALLSRAPVRAQFGVWLVQLKLVATRRRLARLAVGSTPR